MEAVESITKTTLAEIEKVLSSRTIVGDPISLDGRTIIPLISVGFAFGAGGGSGRSESKQKGEGQGGGTGGGAWIRPVAVVISDQSGIKVEPVIAGFPGALEKIGESIPAIVEKIAEKMAERKKEA